MKQLFGDNSGTNAVEYAFLIALLVVAIIAVLYDIGSNPNTALRRVNTTLEEQ